MRYSSIVLFMLLLACISSCDAPKYNEIIFTDDFDYVQNNVLKLDSLLKHSNSKCDAEYSISFNKDFIEIKNDKANGRFARGLICPQAKISTEKLSKLIGIMKKNKIYSVYRDYSSGINVFEYHNNESTDGSLYRELVVNEGDNAQRAIATRKILKKKGRLLLLGPN